VGLFSSERRERSIGPSGFEPDETQRARPRPSTTVSAWFESGRDCSTWEWLTVPDEEQRTTPPTVWPGDAAPPADPTGLRRRRRSSTRRRVGAPRTASSRSRSVPRPWFRPSTRSPPRRRPGRSPGLRRPRPSSGTC